MNDRINIANELREASVEFDDDTLCMYDACIKLKHIVGAKLNENSSQLFSKLADLIDQTCELKIQDGHACCGNCGHTLSGEYESEEDYWCFRPYCPDCGVRVVCW